MDAIRATRFIRVDTREKFPDSIPIEIYSKFLIILPTYEYYSSMDQKIVRRNKN